ncbi:MAG: OmpA family protein [Pseudomonadota bacterium]
MEKQLQNALEVNRTRGLTFNQGYDFERDNARSRSLSGAINTQDTRSAFVYAKPEPSGTTPQSNAARPPAPPASLALNESLVYFDFDSHSLTPASYATLTRLATALKSSTLASATIVIAGHTDSSGDKAYNEELSQKRAESVRTFLIGAGISTNSVRAVGYGETQPKLPDNPTADANRRVEIIPIPG